MKSDIIQFLFRRLVFLNDQRITRPVVNLCILAVVISVAVMIVSICVLRGFQIGIKEKTVAFAGHIQLNSYDNVNAFETRPIHIDSSWLIPLKQLDEVRHVQKFSLKPCILKSGENIIGCLLKGIDLDFDSSFFDKYLIEGRSISFSQDSLPYEVVISQKIAEKLNLKTGDNIFTYFIQQPPLVRKFKIVGIYRTGLSLTDEKIILCNHRHLEKLNKWPSGQATGIEVHLKDFSNKTIKRSMDKISQIVPYDIQILEVNKKFPEIFNWLELQDMNVIIILILMTAVASINIISALLIMMIEKTQFIGIMKAMGARSSLLFRLFLLQGMYITAKGLVWGNIVGLTVCIIQYLFKPLKLNPEMYYLDAVPVEFPWLEIFMINLFTTVIIALIIFLPLLMIKKISPVKAIKFD